MKCTVFRKRAELSQMEHGTYWNAKNRRAELSPIEHGALFLATRRCNLMTIPVSFDPNGGTAEYTEKEETVARQIKFPTATYEDKHLFGWYDDNGTLVTDSDVVSIRTSHLTASWTDPTVVTLDPNGGTCDVATVKLYRNVAAYNLKGIKATGPAATPNFIGWFTAATGGTQIKDTTTYTGQTRLYAHYVNSDWTTQYTVRTTSEYNKTGIYAATRNATNQVVYIDWGDGFTDSVNANISQLVHEYAEPGTYVVRISDNIKTFAISANSSLWAQITSQNFYTVISIDIIAAKVTTIPTYAFCQLNELESAVCPVVAKLSDYAFYLCGEKFKQITVPEGVTSFGNYVFAQCKGLNDVTLPSTLVTMGTYDFQYCFSYAEGAKPIVIPEGVTTIPNYCFDYCQYLNDVTLPSTLTSIGTYAFRQAWYYSKGAELHIPDSVTTIGNYAFYQCRYLCPVINATSYLDSTGTYTFYQCQYELKSIIIPQTCTSLGNYTFSYCTNLTDIKIYKATPPTAGGSQLFGNSAATYTGYPTRAAGTNLLHVMPGYTGFNIAPWSSPLLNLSYCGFTIVDDLATFSAKTPQHWVEFHPNGGTGGGMRICYDGYEFGEFGINVYPPEGKVFDGWWTMPDGGMKITEGSVYTPVYTIVYAHWKDAE